MKVNGCHKKKYLLSVGFEFVNRLFNIEKSTI